MQKKNILKFTMQLIFICLKILCLQNNEIKNSVILQQIELNSFFHALIYLFTVPLYISCIDLIFVAVENHQNIIFDLKIKNHHVALGRIQIKTLQLL